MLHSWEEVRIDWQSMVEGNWRIHRGIQIVQRWTFFVYHAGVSSFLKWDLKPKQQVSKTHSPNHYPQDIQASTSFIIRTLEQVVSFKFDRQEPLPPVSPFYYVFDWSQSIHYCLPNNFKCSKMSYGEKNDSSCHIISDYIYNYLHFKLKDLHYHY